MIEKTSIKMWLDALDEIKSGSKGYKLSRQIYRITSSPKRKRVVINLTKLEKHAKASENIIVPGKILGAGVLDKSFNVCAVEYSGSAMKKLKACGCNIIPISEMLKKDGVRIII